MSAPAHVPLTERQAAVLNVLERLGSATIGNLCVRFDASLNQIGADLAVLLSRGHMITITSTHAYLDTGEGL